MIAVVLYKKNVCFATLNLSCSTYNIFTAFLNRTDIIFKTK